MPIVHPFNKVKDLIDADRISVEPSCLTRYMNDRGLTFSPSNQRQAQTEIFAGLKLLTPALFSHVFTGEDNGLEFDVYCLKSYLDWDWYVKIRTVGFANDAQVVNASFHLPVYDMEKDESETEFLCVNKHKQLQAKKAAKALIKAKG